MKKILFALMFLGANMAAAQGLFPELADFGSREKKSNKPVVEKVEPVEKVSAKDADSDENMPTIMSQATEEETEENLEALANEAAQLAADAAQDEEDLFAAKKQEEVTEQETVEENETEEEADEDEQKIIIYMSSADITTPPDYNFAYCFATLKYASSMKRPVQALDFTLTYGDFTSTFNVRDLVKGVEQSSDKFALVGDMCAQVMEMPQMEIKRCVIEGMDEAKCKKKVTFLPLKG